MRERNIPLFVQLNTLFSGIFMLMGWIFLGIGLLFLYVFNAPKTIQSLWYFRQNQANIHTTGVVQKIETTNTEVNNQRLYAIHYSFVTEEGKTFEGITEAVQPFPQENEQVEIEYVPQKPAISRIKGLDDGGLVSVLFFLLVFPIIGLAFLLYQFNINIKALNLLRIGILTRGKCIGKEPTRTRINEQTVYKFTFLFRAQDGNEYRAIAKSHTIWELTDEPEEAILYDPSQPQKAVLLDNIPGTPRINQYNEVENIPLYRLILNLIAPSAFLILYIRLMN
jgi:hypothetical protein